jgi:mRNA interferase RelE/StbE
LRYLLRIAPRAERDLARLPEAVRSRIVARIRLLASDPRPHGTKKLSGEEDFYRVRVGDYRIVYEIQDKRLVVLVAKVGHRRAVYRRK